MRSLTILAAVYIRSPVPLECCAHAEAATPAEIAALLDGESTASQITLLFTQPSVFVSFAIAWPVFSDPFASWFYFSRISTLLIIPQPTSV